MGKHKIYGNMRCEIKIYEVINWANKPKNHSAVDNVGSKGQGK